LNPEPNPYARLSLAWARFKKGHALAQHELRLACKYQSHNIQRYRYSQAVEYDWAARSEWRETVKAVTGEARIEWVGDSKHPACIVNGIMMFS
jgi:hypothetical protein